MLDIRAVYKLQTDYGVVGESFKDADVTFKDYLAQCRIYISNNLTEDYYNNFDADQKEHRLVMLTTQFMESHKVKVRGYVTREGVIDSVLLLEDMTDAITGVAVLKEALEDPEVDEIQINDMYTIFVQKHGRLEPYIDKNGRVMQFTDNAEIGTVLNKLMHDGSGNTPVFNEGNPILNAKTAKHQYRIAAVYHTANTQDKPPYNFPITSAVIRKFKETRLTIEDLVKYKACTEQMGRFIELMGRAEIKSFFVGPTGSGKTTLLGISMGTTPAWKRILAVQNPAEITFQERDEYRRNTRNVVHWEVVPQADMPTFVSQTLRFTPEVVLIGEMREGPEFLQAYRMMQTGHKVNSTYHAEDEIDAIERYATELSTATSGMSYMEALRIVAGTVDLVVSQYKFPDGRRRVMGVSEIQGLDTDGKVKANQLFKFALTGEVEINEFGLEDVKGNFRQVGVISDKLADKFFKAGVARKELEEFMTLTNAE